MVLFLRWILDWLAHDIDTSLSYQRSLARISLKTR